MEKKLPRCRKTASGKHYYKPTSRMGPLLRQCRACWFVDDTIELKEAEVKDDETFFAEFNRSKMNPRR
jgi:hypothetical protein